MPYHLIYMSMRGRGEPIRWILKAANIDYTEETIDVLTEWANRKKEFEWRKSPVLMVDGQQLHQTTVICRYLAEKHDFISKDFWTVTRQQEVVEGVHDIGNLMANIFLARLAKDDTHMKAFVNKAKLRLPEVFENVEKAITHDGWIYSSEMTWVDVFVATNIDLYQVYFPGTFDNFPKCKELYKRVTALPQIAQWIEQRPSWHMFENPHGLA